jgi:hypothetical protein
LKLPWQQSREQDIVRRCSGCVGCVLGGRSVVVVVAVVVVSQVEAKKAPA